MVCASPDYLHRFGTPRSPEDLPTHRCISFDGLEESTTWTFIGEDGEKRPVAIHSRLTVSTADAAIAASPLGLGLTRVLSYQVADAFRDGRPVRLLPEAEPAEVPASLIYPGQGRLPMKTRAFIDFAIVQLRQRLGALDVTVSSGGGDPIGAAVPLLPATPVQRRRRRLQR